MATIVTKNSSTASAVPTTSDLVQGELAVNVTDKRLFTENASTQIVELGTNPSTITTATATVTGTLTANGTFASSNAVLTGGTVNGVVIGGSTPQAITGTTVTANTGFVGGLTGDVTGNVTGNLTGTVTGNLTASSGTTTLNNLIVNGTADFTDKKLTNVATPTANADAATKLYVDTAVASTYYLGAKAADPTTDNNGNPLQTGALYFNSVSQALFIWNGTSWEVASPINGTSSRAIYIATAAQTDFLIDYDIGFVDVYLNGSKLLTSVDYTAADGHTIVLTSGATSGDIIDIVAYGAFSVADVYTQTQSDARYAQQSNNLSDLDSAATALTNLGLTATAAEINYTDGVTSSIQTQLDSKAETLADLGVTATVTELNYVDGVTSSIQTQIDAKPDNISDLGITATVVELNYSDGVTSNIQTQLDAKPDSLSDFGVTATSTELNYVDGVTSSIQTQLDGKEPADATILKDSDIGSTVQGYDANNTTASNTQTLTNKTLTDPIFDAGYVENVFALSGTTPALDPSNGTIQTWTLSGNSSPTDSLSSGESITLMINDGTAYTITWPTMQWAGGSAPDLATTGYSVVTLWKVSSTLYGSSLGDMS